MTTRRELAELFTGIAEIKEDKLAALTEVMQAEVDGFLTGIEPALQAREQAAIAAKRADEAARRERLAGRTATLADIWAVQKDKFPASAFKVEIEGHGQVTITNLKSKEAITIMQKNDPDNYDIVSFDITEHGVTAPKSSAADVLLDLRAFAQRNKAPAKALAATP